jgi:hypothetical protein
METRLQFMHEVNGASMSILSGVYNLILRHSSLSPSNGDVILVSLDDVLCARMRKRKREYRCRFKYFNSVPLNGRAYLLNSHYFYIDEQVILTFPAVRMG